MSAKHGKRVYIGYQHGCARYTYYFQQINNVPINTYSGISAKFPGPGKYTLVCFINGRGIPKAINYPVKIELY